MEVLEAEFHDGVACAFSMYYNTARSAPRTIE